MANLVDILQSKIDSINLNLEISSVNGDIIYVCKTTLHLTITKVVVINGQEYKIIDFELNKWIQVEPLGHSDPVPANAEELTAPKITFLHGDPNSTNNEYLQIEVNTLDKTPFIWLVEGYEFELPARDSIIEASFNPRLFFLDWADEPEWLNSDHNKRVIKPMTNLLKELIEVINEDFNFKTIERVNSIVRSRFGVEIKDGGEMKKPKKKIIDEDLTGVEAKFKLEIFSVDECLCG